MSQKLQLPNGIRRGGAAGGTLETREFGGNVSVVVINLESSWVALGGGVEDYGDLCYPLTKFRP
ncbi:hypothetical protein U1Q18_005632, partial [Sarracenia purpurea var. burkii]